MKLIVLYGPPAVGKQTVGKELARLTGLKLFHNHLSIELALNFYDFEDRGYQTLVEGLRNEVFQQMSTANIPGLIFTFSWNLSEDYGSRLFSKLGGLGYEVHLVELNASHKTLRERNHLDDRLIIKPSKTCLHRSSEDLSRRLADLTIPMCEESREILLELPNASFNTEFLSPGDVAQQIAETFQLCRTRTLKSKQDIHAR